jgi:hypothetical protein
MVFQGYVFNLMYDNSIMMDEELKPESLKVKDGDVFVAAIVDGRVILRKQEQ